MIFGVPRTPRRPAVLRRGPFLATEALGSGLLTPNQLRSPAWRRVLRGVYADADLTLDHGLRTRAAALVIPPDAAITGVSAAWLWAARLATPSDLVDVVRSPGRRLGLTNHLRVRTSPLPPGDVTELDGIRVTTPVRTAWELALRLDIVEAVTYCDALAAHGWISSLRLDAYLAERAGQHGCRIAGQAFALVDPRAQSPQESRLRVHMALADLPPPIPQYQVCLPDGTLALLDFAWPEVRVAVEYDGVWHADAAQLVRDRERLNKLLASGWYVHHVTFRDMKNMQSTLAAIRKILTDRGR